MKTVPLRLITATALIIGTVYTVSVIASREMILLAMLFIVFSMVKFIIRTTLYIVFQVLKWTVIIAVIGSLLASLS